MVSSQIRTFRDLLVWQKAMRLVIRVYESTHAFPNEEKYGLTSQLRRCAVSIPSNIAERYGRRSTGDYVRFLQIAMGSLYELQTQFEIAFALRYIRQESLDEALASSQEIERMLSSLIAKIKKH